MYRVVLRPAAREDLQDIYRMIAADSPANALAYVARIRSHYLRLVDMPERGASREDIGRGVRLLSFERRVAILYRIDQADVRVLRILYAGRQYPEDIE